MFRSVQRLVSRTGRSSRAGRDAKPTPAPAQHECTCAPHARERAANRAMDHQLATRLAGRPTPRGRERPEALAHARCVPPTSSSHWYLELGVYARWLIVFVRRSALGRAPSGVISSTEPRRGGGPSALGSGRYAVQRAARRPRAYSFVDPVRERRRPHHLEGSCLAGGDDDVETARGPVPPQAVTKQPVSAAAGPQVRDRTGVDLASATATGPTTSPDKASTHRTCYCM